MDERGVADLAFIVFVDDFPDAFVQQPVIRPAQLKRARALDMQEAQQHRDLVLHRQPAEGDVPGVLD